MANTFRLNWFRKLINSCCATRKYRHIDDSHPIASTSDIRNINRSEIVPRQPEKINSTARRPIKCHKRPNIAMTVRMHSVVRNLNSSNKQLCHVTLDPQKRVRNEQLTKTLKSPASGIPSRPMPPKISAKRRQEENQILNYLKVGYHNERDLVATRNIEKMVHEWQARLKKRRCGKNEPAVKGRQSSGMPVNFTKKNYNPNRGYLGLEHITCPKKYINRDVKFARNSARSSRSTDDPNPGNKQSRQKYQMSIVHFKVKNTKDRRKRLNKDIKKAPITKVKPKVKAKPPNPAGSKLVKEEQKRLDILKAEWVQLKVLENACRLRQAKKMTESTVPEVVAPTHLDLASLIVDPKSFLTKVHVKSHFLSVDLGKKKTDDLLKSNVDYPDTSKGNGIGFGELDDGLPQLGPD